MYLWQALIIFVALMLFNIALIFLNFFRGGKIVKNNTVFFSVEAIVIFFSILLLIYRTEGKLVGYLVGVIYILTAIAAIILKSKDFFLARVLTVEALCLVNVAFWYTESHIWYFWGSLVLIAGTIGARVYTKLKY